MAASVRHLSIRSARFAILILATTLLVLAWTSPALAAGSDFNNVRHYAVGTTPTTVARADFDGDGNVDLAAQNANANTVSVRMGSSDGGFERRQDFGVGSSPSAVTSADFDGDAKPDLAVANYWGNSVSVLRGIGDGTFEPFNPAGRDIPAGLHPTSVASADFNGDQKADLAITNPVAPPPLEAGTVIVLLGNGDGTFRYAGHSEIDELATCPSGICAEYHMMTPNQVISGHFNADGIVDLATANVGGPCGGFIFICHPGGVSVLLGRGDGTFQPAKPYRLGISENGLGVSHSLTTMDINGDGKVDLAATVEHANVVKTLVNNGDGTFSVRSDLPVGSRPSAVTDADLDGDGKSDDLAVANFGSDTVSVRLNDDTGTFRSAGNFPSGDGPIFLIGANFNDDNGDGTTDDSDAVDLAVANQNSNTVSVLGPPVQDETAPGTSHVVAPQANAAGWNREEVAVTLTATDTGSGVQEISYKVNDGATTTVLGNTVRIPVRDEGATTVTYHATDQAGNVEGSRSVTVRIDKTAPQVTPEDQVSSDWRNGPLSATFAASDGGSGLANSANASFTLTAANQSASASQPTVVSRTVLDVAGNSTVRRVSALIDLTAPQTSASQTPRPNAAGWSREDVTLTLSATDPLSGVEEIRYSTAGAQNTPELTYDPENPPIIDAEGTTAVTYFAVDEVGNRESARTSVVRLDRTAPTLDTDGSDGSDGITPNNKETGVARDIEPTATFSDELDAASLDGSVKLYAWNAKKKAWKPVPTAVHVEGATVRLDPYPTTPSRMLAAGTRYKATVTTGAQNLAGITMQASKSWTFTTRR